MAKLIIFLGGCLFTWLITHIYHSRSTIKTPEWAKPLIEKLPDVPPSKNELLKIFQEYIETGEVEVDPLLGYVACPNCKASAKDFERECFCDDYRTIVVITCPTCGWSETCEV